MKIKFWIAAIGMLAMLLPASAHAAVTPYPPYPGAVPSEAYRVSVDGQPVFVHHFLTFNQFNWMDYASFGMTGKVHITITLLVSQRKVMTCDVRPLAYGVHPVISGNTVSFDLDQPRYLVVFLNEAPTFYSTGLMLFAEPPEKDPLKLGDPNVVNIQDYKVDGTGKTIETEKINQAIADVSAKPGGGVLYFPSGDYLTGTLFMKSNVTLYVAADAVILGSRKSVDYGSPPAPGSGAPPRALIIFDNVQNAGLAGQGTIDMQGYPWLWHDFQPDTTGSDARSDDGKVNDPHGTGIRGYVIRNCRNISFQGLLLLRSAYWTVLVSNTENFSTHHIKIVNRKQQYHDDAYDFSGCKHVLIENGFAMTMDDTFALYRGRDPQTGADVGMEDFVVRGFVNYSFTSSLAMGYGGAPAVTHLLFDDVHFVANQNKFAIWIQLTPAYFTGRGYSPGAKFSKNAALDDFRFVNTTFENDGGHIYIDGGDLPLTNFVFENCTFYKTTKPSLIMGSHTGPIVFKNVTVQGSVVTSAAQLARAGFDISVPLKFEH